MGRPSKFTAEIASAICERLAGGESLREICEDDALPSRETVRKWLRENEGFSGQYAKAREEQAEFYADEIRDIAHDGRNDWIERENSRTGEVTMVPNQEVVARSRLRVDTLKWLMGKLAPKKYGEKATEDKAGATINVFVSAGNLPSLQSGYSEFREAANGRN